MKSTSASEKSAWRTCTIIFSVLLHTQSQFVAMGTSQGRTELQGEEHCQDLVQVCAECWGGDGAPEA